MLAAVRVVVPLPFLMRPGKSEGSDAVMIGIAAPLLGAAPPAWNRPIMPDAPPPLSSTVTAKKYVPAVSVLVTTAVLPLPTDCRRSPATNVLAVPSQYAA